MLKNYNLTVNVFHENFSLQKHVLDTPDTSSLFLKTPYLFLLSGKLSVSKTCFYKLKLSYMRKLLIYFIFFQLCKPNQHNNIIFSTFENHFSNIFQKLASKIKTEKQF